MSVTTGWWIACIVLVGAELITGSFYLLMGALGLAAAALLSYTDATLTQQVTVAAVVSGGSVAAWHAWRSRHQRRSVDPVAADLGQVVQVALWQPDGTTQVHYRGANWVAVGDAPLESPQPGPHRIVAIDGPRLRIAPVKPSQDQH